MYVISIDKQAVSQMPVVSYPGRIHVIDSVPRVYSAVTALRRSPIVGFDTETRPTFRRGDNHKIALLQLATDTDAFLIRLNHVGIPDVLKGYLEDESLLKVGLSTTDDFHQLRTVSDVHPAGFIELQQVVKQYSITDMSLQKIYAILFGERISKSQQLSNWEAPQLTEPQQRYAAIDAWACLRIHQHLDSGAFVPQQSRWWHEQVVDDDAAR